MWLGQMGAVVPGMMRVVVNQPHFLEERNKEEKSVRIFYVNDDIKKR